MIKEGWIKNKYNLVIYFEFAAEKHVDGSETRRAVAVIGGISKYL